MWDVETFQTVKYLLITSKLCFINLFKQITLIKIILNAKRNNNKKWKRHLDGWAVGEKKYSTVTKLGYIYSIYNEILNFLKWILPQLVVMKFLCLYCKIYKHLQELTHNEPSRIWVYKSYILESMRVYESCVGSKNATHNCKPWNHDKELHRGIFLMCDQH